MSTSSKSLRETTQVPDYTPYTKGTSESSSRAYSYFMVGSMGLISAAGAKSVVSDFLTNMSASSDVLALAKVEVDLTEIPEGKVSFGLTYQGSPQQTSADITLLDRTSSLNGEESPSSFVTEQVERSTRPTRLMSRH